MGDRGPGQGRCRRADPCDRSPLRRGQADHVVARGQTAVAQRPEFDFLGSSPEERKKAVFGCPADDVACEEGGLQVYTTIDLELQKKANEILAAWLPLPPYERTSPSAVTSSQRRPTTSWHGTPRPTRVSPRGL